MTNSDSSEALRAFTDKGGDTETGRAILPDLAAIAQESGYTLVEIATVAGAVFAALDKPLTTSADKSKTTVDILRAIAGHKGLSIPNVLRSRDAQLADIQRRLDLLHESIVNAPK